MGGGWDAPSLDSRTCERHYIDDFDSVFRLDFDMSRLEVSHNLIGLVLGLLVGGGGGRRLGLHRLHGVVFRVPPVLAVPLLFAVAVIADVHLLSLPKPSGRTTGFFPHVLRALLPIASSSSSFR